MRRADLMTQLTVYEINQPATQETKRRRMRQTVILEPQGVRHVATGLNAESLDDALARAGFDAGCPALLSWFGVPFYLEEQAIQHTLQTVAAKMAPGSAVMFDYLSDLAHTPAPLRGQQKRCADIAARRGEPWISSFDSAEMPAFLEGLGYSDVANLEPDEIGRRYFSRHPELVYPPFVGFCHAATRAI